MNIKDQKSNQKIQYGANDGQADVENRLTDDSDEVDLIAGVESESSDAAETDVIAELEAGEDEERERRQHIPGEDPTADGDPNAEGASLAEDEDAVGKVGGLHREIEQANKKPMRKDDDEKAQGGRRNTM